jgi:hypothetical protein
VDFLERDHKDGVEFINHIVRVTAYETRVSFVNFETKEQSKQWMHTHSPNKPKKFKQTLPARKLMAVFFWGGGDRIELLVVEFMQQGTTITSKVYCETPKICVGPVIQNKMHGMLTYDVVLLRDDACPHTAARTPALLQHFNWELFDHPPYSSELLPLVYLPEELVGITAFQ